VINEQLAEFSNLALVVAIVLFVLALIGFGADLAGTSQRRSDERLAAKDRAEKGRADARELQAASVGADGAGAVGSDVSGADVPETDVTEISASDAAAVDVVAADAIPGDGTGSASGGMSAQRFAYLLAGAATALLTLGVVCRALATQRVPWANMYEFATTSAAVVMIAFLAFSLQRRELRGLGTFVVGPVLILLLLAQTVWIVPAAALTPSLQNSHWLYIHISVAIMATALSILGAVVASLQLLQAKHESGLAQKIAAGEEHPEHWGRFGHVMDRLPSSSVLESLSFRIHSIAFVTWTFTLIFGAIWARDAWGRFWGWDPKEVWTFIIWIIYAAYLHARATGGFRGSRAAGLALAGFVAVVFNYTIVNTVINGLHSYSGL